MTGCRKPRGSTSTKLNKLRPWFTQRNHVSENYDIDEKQIIGRGTYSVVRKALHRDKDVDGAFAIKIVKKRYLVSEEERECLSREVEIQLRLLCPYVVRLYEIYESEENLYMVQEFANHGTLRDHMIRRKRFPETEACRLVHDLLEGVKHLHSNGVLHSDIKPENVCLHVQYVKGSRTEFTGESNAPGIGTAMGILGAKGVGKLKRQQSAPTSMEGYGGVSSDAMAALFGSPKPKKNESTSPCGQKSGNQEDEDDNLTDDKNFTPKTLVKLCDFGLARKVPSVKYYKLTGDVHKVPFTGVRGTPGYICPEILLQQSYGIAADIWSVGIMMYELLAGFSPWFQPTDCLTYPLEFQPSIWRNISPGAQALLRKLLELKPADRISAEDALQHPWFQRIEYETSTSEKLRRGGELSLDRALSNP